MSDVHGFKTSKGSVYAMSNGMTTRFKVLPGPGEAKLKEPYACLFVTQQEYPKIETGYLNANGTSLHICARSGTDAAPRYHRFKSRVNIPEGHQPFFTIVENSTGKILAAGPASVTPAIGYVPVEQNVLASGASSVHVGHDVVEIYSDRAAFEKAAPPELLEVAKKTGETAGAQIEKLAEKEKPRGRLAIIVATVTLAIATISGFVGWEHHRRQAAGTQQPGPDSGPAR